MDNHIIDSLKKGCSGSHEYDNLSYVLHIVDENQVKKAGPTQKLLLGKYMSQNIPNIAIVINNQREMHYAFKYIKSAKRDNPFTTSNTRIFIQTLKDLNENLVHNGIEYKVIAYSYFLY